MAGLNHVILIGNLTRDVELRFTQKGQPVASFGMAINGENEDVTFLNITVWDKQAELCQKYLHKGSMVNIVGRIKVGSFEKDGVKKTTYEVVASRVQFLDPPPGSKRKLSDSVTDDEIPY